MMQTAAPARRWTKRLPVLAAALLFSSLLVTACDEIQITAEDYTARAGEYRKKGDLSASSIEAKNALRIDPEMQEARFILGLNYLDLGVWNFAENMLEKAYEGKGVLEYVIIPELAEAKLALGKYDEVLEFARVHNVMTANLKARILAARGRAYSGQEKPDEARKQFNAALQADAQSFRAYLGLAGLAILETEELKAEALLAKATEIAPNDTAVIQFKARNEYQKKNFESSEKEYQKLVKGAPSRFDFQLGLASAQIAAQKYSRAIVVLDKLLKRAPNDPQANYLRSLAAFRSQDYEAAFTFSGKALAKAKDHYPSLLIAGASAYARKQFEQAAQFLGHYVQLRPNHTEGRMLLGEVQLRLKRSKDALETLESAAKERPDNVALLRVIAHAATLTGDMQKSSDYFQKAADLSPEDAQIQAALGVAKIAMGDTKAGIEELEDAIEKDPNLPKAEIKLALQFLKEQRFDDALKAAVRLQKRNPRRSVGFTIEGLTYFAMGKSSEAMASFRKALEVNPKATDAAGNLAELEIRTGNPKKARELLRIVLERYPRHYRALVRLGELEMRLNNPDEAISLLERAVEIQPAQYRPKLLLSQILILTGRYDKALLVAQSVSRRHRDEPAILEVVGQAQMATRQIQAANETFKAVVRAKPQSAYARYLLATSYIGMADLPNGEAALKRALDLEPKDLRSKTALADIQLNQNKLDEAAKTIDELMAESKDQPQLLMLRGRLALQRGKPQEAVKALTEATALGGGTDLTLLLSFAHAQADDQAMALATMQNWLKEHPTDLKVRFKLAVFYLVHKEINEARKEFTLLVEKQPQNWIFLNNLAEVLNRTGEHAEARSYAERAYKLAPSIPGVLDTYGVALLELGELDLAVKVLHNANKGAPKNLGIAYNFAHALARNGQVNEARSILEKIVSNSKPSQVRQAAEELLKTLGG